MSTFKRLCLLLCSLFMFCVGFLSVSSRAYAYTPEDNFYPLVSEYSALHISFDDGSIRVFDGSYQDGKYYFNNPVLNNITSIRWHPNSGLYFPYEPDLFDYYLLCTLTAPDDENYNKSTFKPSEFSWSYVDYNTGHVTDQIFSDYDFYNIDSMFISGFGFYGHVLLEESDNIGLYGINFHNDPNGTGSKPANLVFEIGVLAVEKGQSESAVLSHILNQLQNMENSINSSIGSAADQVTDAIENQYGMSAGESFGVQELTSQVEEKLGVLSFGADTLNNFLGLFQASNTGSTVLTFPGFTIDVQGESYKVWNDLQFDLAFLEENFGFLIDTVRTVTVLCVWLAVLGYMVKAYEHLVNNKG